MDDDNKLMEAYGMSKTKDVMGLIRGESSRSPDGYVPPKYRRVYELANKLMITVGAEGEITIASDCVWADDMMAALYEIDNGVPRQGT